MSQPSRRSDLLTDMDALHSASITLLVLLLSCGFAYFIYLRRAWRVARSAPIRPNAGAALLVFGKRLADNRADAELERRIERAHALIHGDHGLDCVLLLGGRTGAEQSEAAYLHQALQARGLPGHVPIELEDASVDTLQNLRHARELLRQRQARRAVLLSNRYHLARCARLASNLGLDAEVVAAEPEATLAAIGAAALAREALFLMWLDIGTRYARVMGFERMLARVT